jgi:hypothetical protein
MSSIAADWADGANLCKNPLFAVYLPLHGLIFSKGRLFINIYAPDFQLRKRKIIISD